MAFKPAPIPITSRSGSSQSNPAPTAKYGAFYSGVGVPSGVLGGAGDYYIDTLTNKFYGPKTDSGWGSAIIISQGAQGPVGSTGATGPQGIQGNPGPIGPKGDKGDTGDRGIQGPKGDVGAAGATGPVGPQGPKGEQGVKGDTGAAGIGINVKGQVVNFTQLPSSNLLTGDAYVAADTTSLWVWSGSAWINLGSIQGPQGAEGPQGAQGDKGDTGAIATVLNLPNDYDSFTITRSGGVITRVEYLKQGSIIATATLTWITSTTPYRVASISDGEKTVSISYNQSGTVTGGTIS